MFRSWPLALAIALAAAPTAFAQAEGSVQQQVQRFDLPAASLAETLNAIARQSGQVISLDPALVAGKRAPAIQGEMSALQALQRALANNGLQVIVTGGGTFSVVPAVDADGALELGATSINSTGLGETTEDSGSYTTGAMQTATKLPLSMRETPQAVTVITRQRMEDQAMTSVTDVVRNTPGLFLSRSSGPGRPTFSARGFDIDSLMYDGLPTTYQGWVVGTLPNLAMFDRVEVVRGATGLVSGSGNPSAAINLVRKRPTADPRATLTGAAGRWDDYRGEVDASGALNDSGTLRGRVVGSYRDAQSFRDEEEHDHGLFYAITEADLTEDTTLTLGAYRQEDQTNFFWGGLPLTIDGRHMDLPRSSYPGTDWENKEQRLDAVFADLEQRLANDWKLRVAAMAGWQDATFSGSYLSRVGSGPLEHTIYQSKHQEDQQALDVFATGPVQAFGREHELVIGASSRKHDMTTWEYSPYGTAPIGTPKPDFVRAGRSHDVASQDGVYLTTRISLAAPLKLILGGRLDWYEQDDRVGQGDFKVTRNVTRYAGLVYDLDQWHSVYASYTDIFQPQSEKEVSGKVLAPIEGENYEIGIKGEYLDGALNASLAVFQTEETNRAVNDLASGFACGGWYCSIASGTVRSQGLDLEIQGALAENWQVGAGYTYTRARIRDDVNPAMEGERFDSDTPEHLLKLSTVYNLSGPLEKWRVGANLYWQNRIFNDIEHAGGVYRLEQGSYATTDLMLGYRASRELDLQLNVTNVFDRTYYSAIGDDEEWGSTDTYGDPRAYLLTAKYSFF